MCGAFFKQWARVETLSRRILFFSVALFLGLAALEYLTRSVVPAGVDVPHMRVYPEGYYTWYPASRFTYYNLDQVEPPSAEVRINRDGLRGEEIASPKDVDETRILVVGDSFTASVQLPEDQIFTSLLEQRLSHTAMDGRYRVINAGFNGAGTAHELLYYLSKGRALAPDIVVLQVTFNDLDDNLAHGGFDFADGALTMLDHVINPPWWKGPVLGLRDTLGNNSLVFYLTYKSVRNLVQVFTGGSAERGTDPLAMVRPRLAFAGGQDGRTAPEPLAETEQSEASDEDSRSDYDAAGILLAELAGKLIDEANGDGTPVIVMTLPYPLFLAAEDRRFAAAKARLRERISGTNNWLLEMREEFLTAHRLGEEVFLQFDGHLGTAGHRIVAGALERAVLASMRSRIGPSRPPARLPRLLPKRPPELPPDVLPNKPEPGTVQPGAIQPDTIEKDTAQPEG